ncbi:hypothetical protein PybrP1_010589 [[Pythium] brassicae (nom. inval.)]|nr:hypothetical protein PybrP1_010589 [[Pythium] brassicae (nom. inval.)]
MATTAAAVVTFSPVAGGDKALDAAEKPAARVEGLLRKRSSASVYMGSWRYCILHGSRLRWYMSAELARADRELRGEVWVRAVEPWDGHGALNTYPHAFAVRTGNGRVLLCSAPSADAKDAWLAALQQSTAQRDRKPSSDAGAAPGGGGHAHENRRIVPEDMVRQPADAAAAAPPLAPADSESACTRCAVRFGAVLARRHLCGSCAKPFCSRHCAHLVTLAHLGLRAARRCCAVCARRQEFLAHVAALKRFLTTVALNFGSMDAVVRRPLLEAGATAPQTALLERTLTKLRSAPMSLVTTVKILYQTRRKPLLFRAACERLPFYAERCVDRVEHLWYQLLHLFQCCDADAESAAVQLFYLRRALRAICRRAPRIALQTVWHVQAAMGDASGHPPHSLLALLGFIYPPTQPALLDTNSNSDSVGSGAPRRSSTTEAGDAVAAWADVLLAPCPDHQRREILGALAVAHAQSEELIAREPDSMLERWLNAATVAEFEASARELADSGVELCEFQTRILYDSLSSTPSSTTGGSGVADVEALVFDQVQFVQALAAISERLRHVQPPEQRGPLLEGELAQLNARLSPSALYPLCTASDELFRVLRIPPAEGKVFSTKMRAPTLIFLETVPVNAARRHDNNNDDDDYDNNNDDYSYDDDDDDPLRPFLSASRPRHSTFFESLAPPSVAILGDAASSRSSVDGTSEASSEAILGGKERRDSQLSLFADGASDVQRDSGDASAVRGLLSRPVTLLDEAADPCYDDDRRVSADPDGASRGFSLASTGSHKRHGVDDIVYDGDVYGESWEARKARIQRESPFGQLPGWQLFSVIVKTNDDLRQEVFTMQLIHKFRSIFAYESLRLWLRTYRIVATGANIGLLETITDACSLDHLKKHTAGGNLFAYFQRLICEGLVALQKYHSEIAALLQTTGQNSPFPCFEAAKLAKVVADLRDRLCVGLSRAQVARRVDQLLRKSYNAWGTRQYDAFQLRSNNIHP